MYTHTHTWTEVCYVGAKVYTYYLCAGAFRATSSTNLRVVAVNPKPRKP